MKTFMQAIIICSIIFTSVSGMNQEDRIEQDNQLDTSSHSGVDGNKLRQIKIIKCNSSPNPEDTDHEMTYIVNRDIEQDFGQDQWKIREDEKGFRATCDLYDAIKCVDQKAVIQALNNGADPNGFGHDLYREIVSHPMFHVINLVFKQKDKEQAIKYIGIFRLLSLHSQVNLNVYIKRDGMNYSLLHWAIDYFYFADDNKDPENYFEIIRILLKHTRFNKNITVTSIGVDYHYSNFTALHFIVSLRRDNHPRFWRSRSRHQSSPSQKLTYQRLEKLFALVLNAEGIDIHCKTKDYFSNLWIDTHQWANAHHDHACVRMIEAHKDYKPESKPAPAAPPRVSSFLGDWCVVS